MNLNKLKTEMLFALCLFFGLNCFLTYKYYGLKSTLESFKEKDIIEAKKIKTLMESVSFNLEFELTTKRNVLNENFLSHIQSDSGIFFKLNNNECNNCIQKISDILRNFKKSKITIISNIHNANEFNYIKSTYFPDFIFINFNSAIFDKCEENKLINYFFTIDHSNRINNVFVFDKYFSDLTINYLNIMLK